MTDEAAAIESAFHVMTIVPNQANDMMDIGRLQGFEGKIVAQGKLLLHGPLLCTDDPTSGPNYKLKEMTVFLFEQIIIFAETVGRKNQFTSPVYTYKAHIQVDIFISITGYEMFVGLCGKLFCLKRQFWLFKQSLPPLIFSLKQNSY